MSINLELWDSVFSTDPDKTKTETRQGRKITAIDAYTQIHRATELWGPYGSLWQLEVHQVMPLNATVIGMRATFHHPGGQFDILGSVKHTSNKGYIDDDCMKKMYTDTLTKALSYLGFNADVFLGKFDDNKYVQEQKARQRQQATPPPTQREQGQPPVQDLSRMHSRVKTLCEQHYGKDWRDGAAMMAQHYGQKEKIRDLNAGQLQQVMAYLEAELAKEPQQ